MQWPLLRSPLPPGQATVTSGWASPRTVAGKKGVHGAIDFAGKRNTPVSAVADGIVKGLSTVPQPLTGRWVLLEHTFAGGLVLATRYIHLERVSPLQVGQFVPAGAVIGTVGDSGSDKWSVHLHMDTRLCSPAFLDDFKRTFGWPTTSLAPVLRTVRGCTVIPSEPLVNVDGYSARVRTRAATYGIPLATERAVPKAPGRTGGALLLVAAAAALGYGVYRWMR